MYIADVCHPLLSDNLSFQRLTHMHTTVYLCDTQLRSLAILAAHHLWTLGPQRGRSNQVLQEAD